MNLGNFITEKAGEAYADFLSDMEKDIAKEQTKADAWKLAAAEIEADAAAKIAAIRSRPAPVVSDQPAGDFRGPLILAGLGFLAAMVL